MSTTIATREDRPSEAIEQVLVTGDLAKLSTEQRVSYYNSVCHSLGLNPLTKPFDYINLNGKLRLYATRDCTEQLRKIHGVSITRLEKKFQDDLYVVTAYASDKSGRSDASTGVVHLGTKKGEDRANAIMKGETKAKRRVTLSICGLGLLDETEVGDATPQGTTTSVTTSQARSPQVEQQKAALPKPEGYDAWLAALEATATIGTRELEAAWRASALPLRRFLTTDNPKRWEELKAKAAEPKPAATDGAVDGEVTE